MLLLFLSLLPFLSTPHILLSKRSAEEEGVLRYGDEPFTPIYQPQDLREEKENPGRELEQRIPAKVAHKLKPSGYRVKREQNGYGDETVVPQDDHQKTGYETYKEDEENPVDNGYETDAPENYPSGYRK